MFVIGACSGGFQALNAAVIARHVAPAYIGRVMSLTLLAFAGFGLMALPFGILADAVGERATLGVMAVGVTLLAGIGYDIDTYETYVNIEAERRLGDNTVLELRARWFTNAEAGDSSYAIARDDYLQLQLSRYF